jgi:hypothetical protein
MSRAAAASAVISGVSDIGAHQDDPTKGEEMTNTDKSQHRPDEQPFFGGDLPNQTRPAQEEQ